METDRLTYSVAEAAAALGLSVRTVRKLIAAGRLPLVPHTGRRRLIPRKRLDEWVNSSERAA